MTSAPEPNTKVIEGHLYWRDAKGGWMPDELIKPIDRMQDELVREICAEAVKVATAIVDFKVNAFGQIDAFSDLVAENYKATIGGKKGNITLLTYDGLTAVQVQVSDLQTFGPELQAAKQLVVECVQDWSSDSRAELRRIVLDAFDADKEGKINRSKLYGLLKLDIADERWQRAMTAIRDSIRVTGTKRYIRIRKRLAPDASWRTVSLNIADD
jgi:hypothetical protein